MTLMELQDVLGDTINQIVEAGDNQYKMKTATEKAEFISKVAKQMINNADVVLRNDKMLGSNERINKLVGE